MAVGSESEKWPKKASEETQESEIIVRSKPTERPKVSLEKTQGSEILHRSELIETVCATG